MNLIQGGVDTSLIALWLGHESVQTTQIYLHADMTMKERALALMAPLGVMRSRYRPSDELLTFLAGPLIADQNMLIGVRGSPLLGIITGSA